MNTSKNENPYRSKDFPHELFELMCSNSQVIHLSNVEKVLQKYKTSKPFYAWFWENGDGETILMRRSEWESYLADKIILDRSYSFKGGAFGYFLQINNEDGVRYFCEKPERIGKQRKENGDKIKFLGRFYENFTVIANVQESGEINAISPIFNNKTDLNRFVDDVQQHYENWLNKRDQDDWYYPAGNYLQMSITTTQWLYEFNPEKID